GWKPAHAFDLDQTRSACTARFLVGILAQLRNIDTGGVDRIQRARADRHPDGLAIHAHAEQRGRCFSDHRATPLSVHTPAAQCPAWCSRTVSGKCLSKERTGLGAIWPRPHSEPNASTSFNSSMVSRASAAAVPVRMWSKRSSMRTVPSRHGVHLPHDSRKLYATV